jgi:glycosyltransferase involved in cell wall biosynthesis
MAWQAAVATVPARVLSFIVPAYNEELELPDTIAAIRRAVSGFTAEPSPQSSQRSTRSRSRGGREAPGEGNYSYEIVVVDDASTDATAELARKAGAHVVGINRRQIAAARNAGARAARGDVLFFVDADTRINRRHVDDALAALNAGYAGGSARIVIDGTIPLWGRIFVKIFCVIYFANNLGAGAFLFTSRENFEKIGGFDEQLFIGEEVYFSLALRKLGRFKILPEPIVTSGRKLRMYSARTVLGRSFGIIIRGKRAAQSRERLDLWYEGKRESAKM